ncbi:hypothetical protein RAZWK3B_14758 [Roseobacter sp. AzwK-3b]|uniref:hypothetical protein n=1 Tax=Roseobacter sp. AzwK-3b TaxID=351016 RepID=UPI0001569D55|nr:hypothetical protein [Roseobacter sp. AzwK-3b]EDM70667.1 hypothetical protein RAZWK3B_14758 [Roseobacter sp. AzwK-3b]
MTTIGQVERTCALCGKTSEQMTLGSTNAMGAPDLDLRPPEMQRSTMYLWIEHCVHCGYTNNRIDLAVAGAEAVLPAQKKPEQALSLIDQFLTASGVAELTGDITQAANYALCAAWAADDKEETDTAVHCRRRALVCFNTAIDAPDADPDERLHMRVRMVDLLRRCRDWGTASQLAEEIITECADGVIGDVVRFQLKLCKQGDANCYTVADVE